MIDDGVAFVLIVFDRQMVGAENKHFLVRPDSDAGSFIVAVSVVRPASLFASSDDVFNPLKRVNNAPNDA